jgi:hypothetical protein
MSTSTPGVRNGEPANETKELRAAGVESDQGVLPGSPYLRYEALAQAAVRILVLMGVPYETARKAVSDLHHNHGHGRFP